MIKPVKLINTIKLSINLTSIDGHVNREIESHVYIWITIWSHILLCYLLATLPAGSNMAMIKKMEMIEEFVIIDLIIQ